LFSCGTRHSRSAAVLSAAGSPDHRTFEDLARSQCDKTADWTLALRILSVHTRKYEPAPQTETAGPRTNLSRSRSAHTQPRLLAALLESWPARRARCAQQQRPRRPVGAFNTRMPLALCLLVLKLAT